MTMNLYATQQSIYAFLTTEADFPVFDTIVPEAGSGEEPVDNAGYLEPYVVVRFNDSVKVTRQGSFVGARADELYSLVDILCIAADPTEAREIAYGTDGVSDILTGFIPTDGGELTKAGGGQVFVASDGSGQRPTRFIARVSFRYAVNMQIDA